MGYEVESLKRVRIMNLTLNGLGAGEYRSINKEEWQELNRRLEGSYSQPGTETGGKHGNSRKSDKRTGSETEPRGKGILPGRQRNNEQQGVRCSVRSAGKTGKRNRNRSGRQSNR